MIPSHLSIEVNGNKKKIGETFVVKVCGWNGDYVKLPKGTDVSLYEIISNKKYIISTKKADNSGYATFYLKYTERGTHNIIACLSNTNICSDNVVITVEGYIMEKSWSSPAWMRGSGYNIDLGDGYRLVGGLPNMDYYEDYYQSCGTGIIRILKDNKEYIRIIFGNINCRGNSYRVLGGEDKLISFSFSTTESQEQCYTMLKSDGKSTYQMCGASGWVLYKISIKFKTESEEYNIYIDGILAGVTQNKQLTITDIPYGTHTFKATNSKTAEKTILVDKDMTITLEVR